MKYIYISIILLIAILVFKCDSKEPNPRINYKPYDVLVEVHDTILIVDTFNHYNIDVDSVCYLNRGDLIQFVGESEEMLVREAVVASTGGEHGYIDVIRGWNGTTASAVADTTEINFNTVLFKEISDTSSVDLIQSFVTKDIDFGDPSIVKKVYKIYVTYKNLKNTTQTNLISFAVDGNTTFAQTSVSTPQGSGSYALTGVFAASKTNWDIAIFTFSSPLPCQSLALKLLTANSALWINDISFEYRVLPAKKVS